MRICIRCTAEIPAHVASAYCGDHAFGRYSIAVYDDGTYSAIWLRGKRKR